MSKKMSFNLYGKISFYTLISVLAIIMVLAAAWTCLDTSLNVFKSMINSTSDDEAIPAIVASSGEEEIAEGSPLAILQELQSIGINKDDTEAERKKREVPEKIIYVSHDPDTKQTTETVLAGLDTSGVYEVADSEQVRLNNELQASQLLQKYVSAQKTYFGVYNKYAQDASELIIEQDGNFKIIDETLKPINFSKSSWTAIKGYYFKEFVSSDDDKFSLFAIPAQYPNSGKFTYAVSSFYPEKILKQDLKVPPEVDLVNLDSWISE